ncbi:MAG: AAA family ATPase [Planctomycetota bacterium]
MLLRDELQEAATSLAKSQGHEHVEPRHVFLAIARRFRARPEVEGLVAAARQALEPHGTSMAKPMPTAEATALLDQLTSEQEAVRLLVERMSGAAPGAKPDGAGGAAAPTTTAASGTKVEPAATTPPSGKNENPADILAELDALIGLAPVKAQVKNAIAVVQANAERKKAGLAPVNPSLHLVFTGPPGTGKTTVARIVARLYAATGALPGSAFSEASRADLIAGYVGQTAIKTMEVVSKSRPGVLFIDEAYALTPTSPVDFGAEAIATLVKAMEDHRDDFAVIVAGYSDEMTTFIDANPGLRSRFKTYIDFPDYAPGELAQIFVKFAREAQVGLAGGVLAKAEQVFAAAVRRAAFGNARFVRSLFEQAYTRMAARAAADGTVSIEELKEITVDDIVLDDDALRREERRIGFND